MRIVLSIMLTCGMYDGSGRFAVEVGVPTKSGVGGGLMAPVYGRCGIGIYHPRRKKPNYIMLGLSLAMILIVILCDGMYIGRIAEALNDPKSQLDTAKETYILATRAMLNVHRIILVVGAVLAVLVPWYGKLLRKINTNVNIEGNSDMAAIEIEGND